MRATTRLSVLLVALCLSTSPLLAQRLSLGLSGGAVSSKLRFQSAEGTTEADDFLKYRSGVAGGAFLTLETASWLGFQLEGRYVEKGTAFEIPFEGEVLRGNVKLAYAEVPLLVRLGMPTGLIRPFVFGGPALAVELSCTGSVRFAGEELTEQCESEEVQDEGPPRPGRRKLDVGGLAGAGIAVAPGRFSLVFDGRYTRGLRTLDETGESDLRNEAITFTAGVSIPLGNGRLRTASR